MVERIQPFVQSWPDQLEECEVAGGNQLGLEAHLQTEIHKSAKRGNYNTGRLLVLLLGTWLDLGVGWDMGLALRYDKCKILWMNASHFSPTSDCKLNAEGANTSQAQSSSGVCRSR